MKVWLDDIRPTPIGWERAYTAQDAINFLETGKVELISLDHDLADEHYGGQFDARTGYAVVLWLENKVIDDEDFKMPVVRLHTMNPVGREHMAAGLRRIQEILSIRRVRSVEKRIREMGEL